MVYTERHRPPPRPTPIPMVVVVELREGGGGLWARFDRKWKLGCSAHIRSDYYFIVPYTKFLDPFCHSFRKYFLQL